MKHSPERQRLTENARKEIPLEKWGPYLSERQWGTVREDYSPNGDAWNYFPHDHARSRVYRWGEDGLGGISDYFQNLCFAPAFWNGKDPILKERLFGLTNGEGNHGEDVKELYYYLDNVPTHYYMKYLYKYPQQAYPYNSLIAQNAARTRLEPEFEILDTEVFKEQRYFDIYIEYAKQNSEDIFIKIHVVNRFREPAPITVLPTLWFYNRWQYGGLKTRPQITYESRSCVALSHERLGSYFFYFQGSPETFFTENETNNERLFGKANLMPLVKDAFHDAIIVNRNREALRANRSGTKFSPVYEFNIEGGGSRTIYLRLSDQRVQEPFADGFERIFEQRQQEADAFYGEIIDQALPAEIKSLQRQAYAGLLWNKQYYHLDLERWLYTGDGITPVTAERMHGRNSDWKYLKNQDIMLMPDTWEYPWYAAWDAAFHCIAMASIDAAFAKHQLLLLMREWYMNPEGQLPAYEWNFSDVNPPVHAFAALELYKIEKKYTESGDLDFLKRAFQKLIINFTWWTNRKDQNGNNIFEGGFLGLDNIGVFDRSEKLPAGQILEQADGTSWMGMYALNMMDIALEIAASDPAFEDSCTKFYEHFVLIAEALNEMGLWDNGDSFFYDVLSLNQGESFPLKVRSVVGLTPLFAVSIMTKEKLVKLQDFSKRIEWLKEYRVANGRYLPNEERSHEEDMLISLVHRERLVCLLQKLVDENEFLSAFGIRALSKYHEKHPYMLRVDGISHFIQYDPADSTSGLFGGNSNWRGPIWMPVNFLVIKALEKYGDFYGDSLKVEFPTGSGNYMNSNQIAHSLRGRFLKIFERNASGDRPLYDAYNWFYKQEQEKDLILFHEYFHGDTGRGLGASHQTGWTALLVELTSQ